MNKDLRDKILSFRQPRTIIVFGEDIETFDKEMLIATCHLFARDMETQTYANAEERKVWFEMLKDPAIQERSA